MKNNIMELLRKVFKNPVITFVVIASVFGLVSTFITPPFDKPDESANFIRAYGISNGELFVDAGKSYPGYDIHGTRQDGSETGTVSIPISYRESRDCLGIGGSYPWMSIWFKDQPTNNDSRPYKDPARVIQCFNDIPLAEERTEHLVGHTAYSPISHIPQVIAIWIGKLFDMPIIAISYLVRVLNLVFWIALVAIAIKLLPRRQWAFALVSLFPAFTFSVAHAAVDATLFGAIAIFMAVIIRSLYLPSKQFKKELKILTIITLTSAVVMVLAKSSYGVLFLPLLLFFGGIYKFKIAKVIALLILIFLSFSPLNDWQLEGGNHSLQTTDVKFIAKEFPKAVVSQLVNGDSVSPIMFTGAIVLPSLPQAWVMILASMLLILLLAVDYERANSKFKLVIKNKERLLFLATSMLVAVIVFCGALFLLWQQFGLVKPVPLVPGRYFLSLLMLFAIVPFIYNIFTTESTYKKIGIYGIVILNTIVLILYTYGRYIH